tara:strand:+ start:9523 stop:10998 length:1476 start_codon:yes stop_codon:yes gene_type:complete
MNTHTVYLTSGSASDTSTAPTIEMFDLTELALDLSQVYSNTFPNYLAINWGDNSGVEEPDVTIYRDYKTTSILPEIEHGASPVFFNKLYKHIFYPSSTALKKTMTMRVNIGYLNGDTTRFTIPINVRTEGYYETIEDLDLLNVSLLNEEDNNSIYTFLTKKDNFVIQNHNNTDIEYTVQGNLNLSSYEDTSLQSINETQSLLSAVTDPVGAEAKFKFIESVGVGSASWTTTFWGYSNRDVIDFSGVSYKATGFGDSNNLILITPRHAIGVSHFNDDPGAGDIAYFYDQTTGNSVSATISAASDIGNDLRVISFSRDISTATTSTGAAGSIKLYKLPRFENEVTPHKYPVINQAGNYTFSNDHHAGLGTPRVINQTHRRRNFQEEIISFVSNYITVDFGPTGMPDYRLTNVSPSLSSYNLSLSGLSGGDSGGPIFIPYSNELLLTGLWQTRLISKAGSSVNIGNTKIQSDISAGMETVGNTWGYKLSTVRLS